MVEYISDLKLFCAISRTLNFRKAGESLGYSPAVVTSRMKRLEVMTGKTLFIRSTRHIRLTEEGQALLKVAEKVLDLTEIMSAENSRGVDKSRVSGTVRIAAPHSFARVYLIEPIKKIMAVYPNVTIDLLLDDAITEIIKEGIDISFRVGGEDFNNVEVADLFPDHRIFVASPEYAKRCGLPQTPAEISQHTCLSYPNLSHWNCYRQGNSTRVTLQHIMHCNTGDYLTKLAVAGVGITVKSAWSVNDELSSGQLIRVLPDYTGGVAQTVRALGPKRDYVPNRVNIVFDIIRQHIREVSGN